MGKRDKPSFLSSLAAWRRCAVAALVLCCFACPVPAQATGPAWVFDHADPLEYRHEKWVGVNDVDVWYESLGGEGDFPGYTEILLREEIGVDRNFNPVSDQESVDHYEYGSTVVRWEDPPQTIPLGQEGEVGIHLEAEVQQRYRLYTSRWSPTGGNEWRVWEEPVLPLIEITMEVVDPKDEQGGRLEWFDAGQHDSYALNDENHDEWTMYPQIGNMIPTLGERWHEGATLQIRVWCGPYARTYYYSYMLGSPTAVDQQAESGEGEDAGVLLPPEMTQEGRGQGAEEAGASGSALPWLVGGAAVAVGAGGVAIALGKKRGSAAGNRRGEKKPENKQEKEKEEKDRNVYAMRIFKEFGDSLTPGADKLPIYARIVRIDPQGIETTDMRLTSMISISSPAYLQITDQGMAGEYMAAHVYAPLEGQTPDSAVVAFALQSGLGHFTNRVHFKVEAPAEIVFFQENLGLPAHYEKEARLLFYAGNLPKGALVTASFWNEKPPYQVRVEPYEEGKGFYYAVLRDVRMDDTAPPGNTREWGLQVQVKSAAGKTIKETEFSVLRIHLGLSFLMEGDAIGCYWKAEDGQPCMTRAKLLLLEWDDEAQEILRIAPVLQPDCCTVVPKKVVNDNKATCAESNQERVDALGIMAIPTRDVDENGARVVYLTATKAALDRPTRIWSELTLKVNHQGREYSDTKKILLHSMPFRHFANMQDFAAAQKMDEKIFEQLLNIQKRIMPTYYHNLFSLYNLIDRMTDGYDFSFGYDQNQLDNVMKVWVGFLDGSIAGANADAVKLTLADELSAAYAFLEGMRDNGGLLGRIALGICTAGYSETVFFTMDLYEKMEVAVNKCSGDEFGFWDGVVLGVKEYEISLAQQMIFKGVLKGGNAAIGRMTGVDLGKTISANYSRFIGKADKTLRQNSRLYAKSAEALDKITNFTNSSAKALSDARKKTAEARAAAEQKISSKLDPVRNKSIAELRQGGRYKNLTPEQLRGIEDYDLAMENGMNKVRELDKARHAIKRGSPDFWEKKAEYREKVFDVLSDPNAKKQLRALGGSAGLTNRAEFNRVRNEFNTAVKETFLDNCASRTGKLRKDLYVQSVSSNKLAEELAGKSISEDLDVTAAETVYSDRTRDVVIGQTLGEEELAKAVYEKRFGAPPASAAELEAAKALCQEMDITYVSPGGDYGYVIEHNPEAYFELDLMIDKAKYSQALQAPTMTRTTIQHKANEWYHRGDECYQEAYQLEARAAGTSSAEARASFLEKAQQQRIKGQGCYVEGTRQLKKTVNNIADARNEYRIARGEGDLFTPVHRELQALNGRVGSREAGEICPQEFFLILEQDYGLDKYGLSRKMSEVFS